MKMAAATSFDQQAWHAFLGIPRTRDLPGRNYCKGHVGISRVLIDAAGGVVESTLYDGHGRIPSQEKGSHLLPIFSGISANFLLTSLFSDDGI